MNQSGPRRVAIEYPASILVNKFLIFGFNVYSLILNDGRVETIIEETDFSNDYFSILLKGLKEKEFYYAYLMAPGQEFVFFQPPNIQQVNKTLP
jgi:hypothetical protein